MKKSALTVLVVLAALAVLAASAYSRAPAVAVPQVAETPAKEAGPLLAVVPGARGPVLGRADKRAIWVARRSPKLRIFNQLRAWVYAPDGGTLALGTQPGSTEGAASLQFVEPRLLQRRGMTRLPWGNLWTIAWGDDRVNAVLTDSGRIQVVGVDSRTHKLTGSTSIAGRVFAAERVGARIVLLTAPACGIGTAGLAVVDPGGSVRTVALPQIAAGNDFCDDTEGPDFSKLRQNIPGLAVDPESGRAFVVPGSGSIAEVALSTLSVSYHSLAQPVSLLGRLHDWVEPKAEAKGANGPVRTARWLGNGVLGVTGGDETATLGSNNQLHVTWSAAGLTLIDTNSWGTKLIDRGADSFVVDGDTLLVTGSSWSESNRNGMGLAAYRLDGTRKLSLLHGESAYVVLAFRGKAYLALADSNATTVVDLVQGKVTGVRHAPLAYLLISPPGAS